MIYNLGQPNSFMRDVVTYKKEIYRLLGLGLLAVLSLLLILKVLPYFAFPLWYIKTLVSDFREVL